MLPELTTLSPRQTFEDNMRPAQLLLRVYRLLDCNDQIQTDGDMVHALRLLTKASAEEDLMVVYNEIFLGLVRERAQIPRSTLRQSTLHHLLRQAVVASCTALETFLPALLRTHLPVVIRARGRDFVPRNDRVVLDFFSDLTFSLEDTLRLLEDENAPEFISNKILTSTKFKYLSSRKGVQVTGALLGLNGPWQIISSRLNRDDKELMKMLDDTVNRRNDIVHRADRPQTDPGGDAQDIGFAWTQQAVDVVQHVCLALDELVAEKMTEMKTLIT